MSGIRCLKTTKYLISLFLLSVSVIDLGFRNLKAEVSSSHLWTTNISLLPQLTPDGLHLGVDAVIATAGSDIILIVAESTMKILFFSHRIRT